MATLQARKYCPNWIKKPYLVFPFLSPHVHTLFQKKLFNVAKKIATASDNFRRLSPG
jgi:hypothetical protein